MENALYDFLFTRWVVSENERVSATQLVNKNRTRAFSMEQSLYLSIWFTGQRKGRSDCICQAGVGIDMGETNQGHESSRLDISSL